MKNLSIVALSILFLICLGVSAEEKIDINTAPLNNLIKIIHIGEKRGLELISLRPFSSLDDLARIKGIGPVRIEDIKKQGLAYVETFSEETDESSEIVELIIETEIETKKPSLAAESEISSGTKTDKALKIDINAASAQDLQTLVGIGTVLAQRIIELRPFYTLDELTKVNGIGAATLENIKNQGLAWVDPNLAPPKAEESKLFDKGLAVASLLPQEVKGKKAPRPFLSLLSAFTLAIFSGITILTLKKRIETPS